MDRGGRDAVALELLGEPVGAVLGPGEDEGLVDAAALDEVAEQLALALAVDRVTSWLDELRGGVARRDLDGPGRGGGRRELADLVGEGRREQEVLARAGSRARILRMSRMKPMSSIRSASSRTRISTCGEVDRALADVVEQAAGGGDDDLGAAAQGADLGVEADAAVDGDRRIGASAVGADALLDLERELAGRGEDQRADAAAAVAAAGVQALDHRQHEGGRLAGAGLGAGEEVAAGEDERDGLGLDGVGSV